MNSLHFIVLNICWQIILKKILKNCHYPIILTYWLFQHISVSWWLHECNEAIAANK